MRQAKGHCTEAQSRHAQRIRGVGQKSASAFEHLGNAANQRVPQSTHQHGLRNEESGIVSGQGDHLKVQFIVPRQIEVDQRPRNDQ